MNIKTFDEFVNEAFLSKTYNRYKTGKERLEDTTSDIQRMCTFLGELISKKADIPFTNKLVAYQTLDRKSWQEHTVYVVTCDISSINSIHSPFIFSFRIQDDSDNIASNFIAFLNGFTSSKNKYQDMRFSDESTINFLCFLFSVIKKRTMDFCTKGNFVVKPDSVNKKELFRTDNIDYTQKYIE